MRAIVDAETCSGCESCVETCPEVFEMGEEELAVVKANPVPDDCQDACVAAADECPVDAISIET